MNFFPTSSQTVIFDYVSIAYIIILVITLLVGIKKGFISTLISLLSFVAPFIIGVFLCKYLASFLAPTSLGSSIENGIYDGINSMNNEIFSQIVTNENKNELIPQALQALNIPSIFNNAMTILLDNIITAEEISLGLALAKGLTNYILLGISFVILWFVSVIIFAILKRITRKINHLKVIGFINRFLGALLGIVLAIAICVCINFVLSYLMNVIPSINEFMTNNMKLNDENSWSIAKALYELDLINKIISSLS